MTERLPERSVLDELWIELAINGRDALNELVRIARKKYLSGSDAEHLGVPSKGMVAYLVCVGKQGDRIEEFALRLRSDSGLARHLATVERELADAVQGGRNFPVEWFTFIGLAAGLSPEVVDSLIARARLEFPAGEPYVRATLEPSVVAAAVESHQSTAPERAARMALTTIAGVAAYAQVTEENDLPTVPALLSGVIVHRKKYRYGLTYELTDGLETIQLVAKNDCPCFEIARTIKENDRITCSGTLGISGRGRLSVYLETCNKEIGGEVLFDPKELLRGFRRRGLPPRFTLGRAVQIVDDVLNNEGYIRYEPSYISTALHSPDSIESLEVYFPGWGAMTNLVPTPVPQLIRMGIGLGVPRVFASSRVMTRAIRDGYTSPDSPAAFLFALNASVEGACREIERVLAASITRFLKEAGVLVSTPSPSWPMLDEGEQSSEVHHEVLRRRTFSDRSFPITPFRSFWFDDHVIAEGHVAHVSDAFGYFVASVHTERIIHLLLSSPSFRRVTFHGPEEILVVGTAEP